jgi:hypothetical protein
MYINYNIVGGIEYGTVVCSVRNGNKVGKGEQLYLGRVIDKELSIFKSRERGIFIYNLEANTFQPIPADYEETGTQRKTRYSVRPTLVVSFGDVYLLNEYIKMSGFIKAIDAIGFRNADTINALFAYYILSPHANNHAEDWWNLTYARYLYPKAQLASQRISDALVDIGSEDAKRCFFREYYRFLEKRSDCSLFQKSNGIDDGILIDSSGLPNSIHFPLTAVNNHNGTVSEEVRLIYVVQQRSGLPLFFRYVAGNVIDVTTLTRTIAELKANGINTKFAILDAGYYTGVNADILLDAGVSFMTRMKSNFKVYKQIVKEHLASLECKENLVRYNRRLIYIKCVPCLIGDEVNRPAYAYLCKDLSMKRELEKHLIERAEDQNMSGDDVFDAMQEQGIFVLIASRKISRENLLPLYYTRDQVEKIFELCKQEGKILPLNVGTEATFRGHLLMTFMATVMLKLMSDKLRKTSLTIESLFMNLHEQHAVIYDDVFVTAEPVKKMNEAYKAFNVLCPPTIPREGRGNVD